MSWGCEWSFLWGEECADAIDAAIAAGAQPLTSGSWTYEAFYRFPLTRAYASEQSLARFCVFSNNELSGSVPILNCISVSGSDTIDLYMRPTYSTASVNVLSMSLTGVNVFDGNQWNISFGRFRSDDPVEYLPSNMFKSDVSSSYFLRAARAQNEKIVEQYVTSTFFLEDIDSGSIAWNVATGTIETTGPFLTIGSQSLSRTEYGLSTSSLDEVVRNTFFDGKVGHIRFWSKGLLLREWQEHVRNFKSLGVVDPSTNFNFATELTHSWGRLRIDASSDQIVTQSNSGGQISIFDFSQNSFHLTGSNFEASQQVIKPETFYYSYISPKFDEAGTINKVRARGYQDSLLASERGASIGVVHRLDPNEEPQDDARFSIDFSIIDALDQDIINIFATFEELENVIGDPELQFSPDYPQLENLREIYFNRLDGKINLKSFFEFFKWFDKNIGNFISALLPRKTRFKGVNFVIESHMLERPKFENLNNDQYLQLDTERNSLKGNILLQQFEGIVKKY